MNEQKSLIEQLHNFGLDAVEAKIYLYLLNKDPRTILEIARDLDIPRTSIYDNSLKLIEKGLVERVIVSKSQKLRAYPLDILQSLITREKAKIEDLENQLMHLKEVLSQSLAPTTTTEVRHYHGVQGFRQITWNTLKARDELIGYSEFGRVEVVGQSFLQQWRIEMLEKKITDRVITNPKKETLSYLLTAEEKESRAPYQTVRILEKDNLYITGDTTIYNNIFAVCYWKQGEVVGVEIENPELVKTQKSIFEILWQLAKPISEYLPE